MSAPIAAKIESVEVAFEKQSFLKPLRLSTGLIEQITEGVKVGKIYNGRVTSIKDFGAFVEILPGKDGLCHISELADEYVATVSDICKVGDPMQVKVIAVDDQDRVKLSRRAAIRELNPNAPPVPAKAGRNGGR